MKEDVIPAVKAVVVRDGGRVLLLKRSEYETHLQGMWDVPGGSVDYREHPEEAVEREAMEEAGIEVEVLEPVHVWSYTDEGAGHRVGITYLCSPLSEEIELGDEHTDYRWATADEIDNLDIYEDLRGTVKDVMERNHGLR